MTSQPGSAAPSLFYDGNCGVCHLWVRIVLALDPGGAVRFAPLGGETFLAKVAAEDREGLPDSLVVVNEEGRLLTRSAAVLFLLNSMGWPWRAFGGMCGLVPRRLADAAYDAFARRRHWLAPRPKQACPMVPAPVRARFDP